MFAAVLELRTWGERLAEAVGEDVHGHDKEGLNFEEGLNFPLEQDVEEVIYSFWLIMLLQILRTIAMDSISHNKTESRLLFIDSRCIFPSMDEDEH